MWVDLAHVDGPDSVSPSCLTLRTDHKWGQSSGRNIPTDQVCINVSGNGSLRITEIKSIIQSEFLFPENPPKLLGHTQPQDMRNL